MHLVWLTVRAGGGEVVKRNVTHTVSERDEPFFSLQMRIYFLEKDCGMRASGSTRSILFVS